MAIASIPDVPMIPVGKQICGFSQFESQNASPTRGLGVCLTYSFTFLVNEIIPKLRGSQDFGHVDADARID